LTTDTVQLPAPTVTKLPALAVKFGPKLDPTIVRFIPASPIVGEMDVITGMSYEKVGAPTALDVCPETVTSTTWLLPCPGPTVHTIWECDCETTEHDAVPIVTVATVPKFEPAMVMFPPPRVGAEPIVIPLTVGALKLKVDAGLVWLNVAADVVTITASPAPCVTVRLQLMLVAVLATTTHDWPPTVTVEFDEKSVPVSTSSGGFSVFIVAGDTVVMTGAGATATNEKL